MSDHASVTLKVGVSLNKGNARVWRFPSYLAKDQKLQAMLQQAWQDYAKNNKGSVTSLQTYWDAVKACIRGNILTQRIKKHGTKIYRAHSDTLRQAKARLNLNLDSVNRKP